MDLETTRVAARHFVKLAMFFCKQRGTTARSTDREGKLPYSSRLRWNPETTTTSRHSRGVCETTDWPPTTRVGLDRAKQAV